MMGRRTGKALPDWRSYQKRLKRKQMLHRLIRRFGFCSAVSFLAAAVIFGVTGATLDSAVYTGRSAAAIPHPPDVRQGATGMAGQGVADGLPDSFTKETLRRIIREDQFAGLREGRFQIHAGDSVCRVETTLEPFLQGFLLDSLSRNKATSRYMGVVVMEPASGRILAMAGYDRENTENNPCLESIFPAASVFKIVTAAAAVEECGLGSESPLSFDGGKYTLYKSQIENRGRPGSNRFSLRDAFAQSVNPVFGRLGAHCLGKPLLESYAEAFGFNQPIPFEIPVEPSRVQFTDDPYQWAEVACGFNRTTLISPLHGAMIAASVAANDGRLMEPAIVERVTDAEGRTLYSRKRRFHSRAVQSKAAETLKKLMRETIRTGTCRKYFRGVQKDPVLSRLDMGGKTGSIGSRIHEGRKFDWFVGFAGEKGGNKQIVLSIVIAHDKYIGIQSREYARMTFAAYFKDYFSRRDGETAGKNAS